MGLRMPALVRTKSGWRARKAIPTDVRDQYKKLYGPAYEEKLFLPDLPEQEAKIEYTTWLNRVEGQIKGIRALRRGEPQALTRAQAHALAGEWRAWFIARYKESEPGQWTAALHAMIERMDVLIPEKLEQPDLDAMLMLNDPVVRVGIRPMIADKAETAQFLATKGLNLAANSYSLFLDHVAEHYVEALLLLRRPEKIESQPSDLARQYPQLIHSKTLSGQGITAWTLFEMWVKEAKPAASTVNRWRGVFLELKDHFKDQSADAFREDEARQWARSLVTDTRSPETVSAIYITAARRVFAWGVEHKHITSNPFKEVKVTVPAKVLHRETKAFTPEEYTAILQTARAVDPGTNTFKAAKRWMPWLCAYTGARAGEIAQLRAVDVIPHRNGFWTLRLTPEAGTMKMKKARTVPLHEHIIAQGFLDFVASRANGPLFYNGDRNGDADSDPTNPKRPRAVKTRERLAAWVRELGVVDSELSPNHAWRHTFKQIAERHGISERISDAITGHAPATVGRAYGSPTIEDMAAGLAKFPRYKS